MYVKNGVKSILKICFSKGRCSQGVKQNQHDMNVDVSVTLCGLSFGLEGILTFVIGLCNIVSQYKSLQIINRLKIKDENESEK